MEKRPLIIDCDPGVDDALSIMMLQASGMFDILGITPVQGNVPLRNTARNSLFLSRFFGIGCPVYRGADHGILLRMPTAEYAHGKNGLGDFPFELEKEEYGDVPAWEFIWRMANRYPGELEIIALGPLTNIAIAVKLHPELVDLVKQIVIMGGSSTDGNATPLAEFNIYQDPHGAQMVFEAGFRSLTMVGLNACNSATLNKAEMERMRSLPASNPVAPLARHIVDFRIRSVDGWMSGEEMKRYFKENLLLCDAVAAAVLMDPSVGETEDRRIFVETRSGLVAGQTVVDWLNITGAPNVRLCRKVDRDRFSRMFFECLDSYDRKEA